jgi:hypothetical protein
MKYSDRYAIPITMTASFAVTLGILLWQRKAVDMPPPAPMASALVEPPAPARMPMPAAEVEPRSQARAPAISPVRAAPAANDGAQQSNSAGPDLPVTLDMARTTVWVREEGPDGAMRRVSKDVNDAIISNQSDQVLTITAIDANPSTEESTQTEFVLGPNGQKHLNIDDGVGLLAGDQLTLRSPPFRDRTQQIP